MSNDSNDKYVCFKGEKVEKYDKKKFGPDFWSARPKNR